MNGVVAATAFVELGCVYGDIHVVFQEIGGIVYSDDLCDLQFPLELEFLYDRVYDIHVDVPEYYAQVHDDFFQHVCRIHCDPHDVLHQNAIRDAFHDGSVVDNSEYAVLGGDEIFP